MRKIDPVRHEEKRREILEAAGRCFLRSGFQGATIAQICAEAGMSPGHLYHYFASKDEIIVALATVHFADLRGRFKQTIEGGDKMVAGLLAEMKRVRGGLEDNVRPLLFDMLSEANRNDTVAGILRSHSRIIRDLISGMIRHGQARGEIDPALDADLAAAIIQAVIDGSKALMIRDPGLPLPLADDLFERLISRFLAPAPA